ncbi:MAG: ribulose-phosphate 3-epimerase [Oscillospiraceae bacterium]|nr:ribulose-phosphate 3-epimerase [Oscillospiraceae bacterium]
MIKISPSVLAADFSDLRREAQAMENAGVPMLHLDVMDGHFVPNLSFGAPVIRSLRPYSGLLFDVHLMISDPLRYLDDYVKAGADLITFHLESDSEPGETIRAIRAKGKKAGLALKPATPWSAAEPYLDELDMLVVMTVEPGFGGQSFMEDMMPKVRALRQELIRRGKDMDIMVDGGIAPSTAKTAVQNGANVLVAGSALFGKPDYSAAVRELLLAAQA